MKRSARQAKWGYLAVLIDLPQTSLVILIGTSGSGKSTFAAKHFLPTETLSSDHMRGIVSDDEGDQSASNDAFDALHHLLGIRLRRNKLTVIDATNVLPESRKELLAIARKHHVLSVAIVFDIDEKLCVERNKTRPDRDFGPHVIFRQHQALRRGKSMIRKEGFLRVYYLNSPEDVEKVEVKRTKLFNDLRELSGPFDIIGDVHGCIDELRALFDQLGYTPSEEKGYQPPAGRTAIAITGRLNTEAKPPSSTGTPQLQAPNGSTARFALIVALLSDGR